MAVILAISSLFMGSILADAASADIVFTDTGFDADDTSGPGVADVVFTRRTVWTNANGRRWFTVRVRASDPLGSVWNGVDVFLDYRGGPRKDARITMVNIEGPPYCGLLIFPGEGWDAPAVQVNRTILCSFRLSLLDPTKRIRWRVLSPSAGTIDPTETDRAPDSGWYT